jgi:pimeloyl-ACP methyl ester carboxylesterase
MRPIHVAGVLTVALSSVLTACALSEKSSTQNQAPAAAPAQAMPAKKNSFVLVHGAWAAGWEWKKVGDLLLAHGQTVSRPSLTGQGERYHLATTDVDLNTHITDIVNVILFDNLRDVVLMGHSYGGMVITGVADRVPDRIKCIVYVDAFLPEDGESVNSLSTRPRPAVDGYVGNQPRPNARPPFSVAMPAKTFSQAISLKNQTAVKKIPTTYILTVEKGTDPAKDTFYNYYERAKSRGWFTEIMEGDHVIHINQTAKFVELLEAAPDQAKVGNW